MGRLVPVKLPPGIVQAQSDQASAGRWIDCDKVRFVDGYPQKLGGVQRFFPDQITGIVRGAKAWNAYSGAQCLMFGSACELQLYRNDILSTLTPYRSDAINISLTDPFETTSGSAIVTVNDTAHNIETAGRIVVFSGASAVGGVTIDGEYTVTEVIDANTFTITHSSAAASTATGGGSVTASYTINCGRVDAEYLLGWGVGAWGEGYWGTDRSIASTDISEPRTWSMDVYGEDLLINPVDGAIYVYDAGTGTNRPSILANAPTEVRFVFVTPERYIMALGCNRVSSGNQDDMVVRWPDVDDNTDWTPTTTNRSNERKLQGGTRLMAGCGMSDGISLVWSDYGLFLFQYTGSTEIYSSRLIASKCGMISPNAWAKVEAMAFWMSENNFWMWAGYAQPIPNVQDIRTFVFDNLNKEQQFKSFAFLNSRYNEIWFVYPHGDSTEPNRYAAVDLDTYAWILGTWDRSAAAVYETGETRPVLFGQDGYAYVHEVIENPDDNGAAMNAYIEAAPLQMDDGNRLIDVFGFIPDFKRQTGDMSLYIYGLDHPRDSVLMSDMITIEDTSKREEPRVAGRQVGFKMTSNVVGGDFRLGEPQIEIQGAGSRI